MAVAVTELAFDPGAELNSFRVKNFGGGAVVVFTGLVRAEPGDGLSLLQLQCYPELAVNQLNDLESRAIARFTLLAVQIIHRYGDLTPNEPIVQVMTLAAHREAAFKGAEFLMDYLKTDAPFWKQETVRGVKSWVNAHAKDDVAKTRWM